MTGFNSKREAAADKMQKPWNEDEWRKNNWRCQHGWLRGEQCEICNAPKPAQEPVSFPCCGYTDAIKWNQGVVQCHMCGQVYTASPAAQEPYDQTALELCNVCGWKTLIPDDGCLNCERAQPVQEPVAREWNFCERCGKRTKDLNIIHTCTPPQEKNL